MKRRTATLFFFCVGIVPIRVSAQGQSTPANNSPSISTDTSLEPILYEKVRGVIRFGNDGTGSKEASARIRVQTYTGIQKIGQLVFPYNGSNERVEVKSLTVTKPDGTVVTAGAESVVDVSSPVVQEAAIYTDARQKHLTVPGLSVGDIVEYDVVTRVFEPLTPGQFWDTWNFVTHSVCLEEELVLDVPADRALKIKYPGDVEPTVTDHAGRRTYSWKTENKKVVVEANPYGNFRGLNPAEGCNSRDAPASAFLNLSDLG